jgi:hypothetical protein
MFKMIVNLLFFLLLNILRLQQLLFLLIFFFESLNLMIGMIVFAICDDSKVF